MSVAYSDGLVMTPHTAVGKFCTENGSASDDVKTRGCLSELLSNVIFIVDEAQNLTPHEVKTIITRAGENSKIILTGDVRQIDTPYLDEQSNGMSYVIDRLKGRDLFCHVTLDKGERSELANLANEHL